MRFGCCGNMIVPDADPIGIGIVESLAAFGFDFIELSLRDIAGLPEAAFRDLSRRLDDSGLRCEACNNFFPPRIPLTGPEADLGRALDYAERALDRAARLGTAVVVFGSSGARNVPEGFDRDRAWAQLVEILARLGPLAGRHGVTIAVEPISRPESNILNYVSEGLHMVSEVDHPRIGLLADFFHMALEKEDPAIIGQAGPQLRHLHFADPEARRFPLSRIGAYVEFFSQVRLAGYRDRCSVEASTRDFAAEAPAALRLLKELTTW